MKRRLTHLLLAFALLCAQALTAAHAIEHALADAEGLPPHVCQLCVAAHDLGSGLSNSTTPVIVVAQTYLHFSQVFSGRSALPAPQARQQSPPIL